MRGLVVDADALGRNLMRCALEQVGVVCDGADGFGDVDRRLQEGRHDVLVVDGDHPGDAAMNLLRRLRRARWPGTILYTGQLVGDARLHELTRELGVRAVFLMAPGGIEALAPASLHALTTPVRVLFGDADTVAPPASNGQLAADSLPHAALRILQGVGHYDFLARCTALGRQREPLCQHMEVPQSRTHASAIADAEAFFARQL